MLDKWLNAIVQRLNTTAAAVTAKRTAIEKERASDTARDHAGREFVNSEGYTTPLPKAAQNAQNEYARARRDFEKVDLMGALSVAVAMMIARERRDETAAALKAYLEAEDLRQSEGVHPEVKPFFANMFAMGIEPRRLPYVREEVLAIICDMIMWDGHDRDMQDPDSPMPAIFELYGSRLILKPGQFCDRSRSTPGVPKAKVKYTDPDYYLFGGLVPVVADDSDTEGGRDLEGDDAAPVHDDLPWGGSEGDSKPPPGPVSKASPPPLPIVLHARDDERVAEAEAPMSPEYAQRIAESVFEKSPVKMGIYWPKEIERGDFDEARLIPALERWVASDDNWTGAERFLAAARRGEARAFIDDTRRSSIASLATRLAKGDRVALDEARRVGALD